MIVNRIKYIPYTSIGVEENFLTQEKTDYSQNFKNLQKFRKFAVTSLCNPNITKCK